MELKLEDGRYVPSKFLGFERVSEEAELLQRIEMKLKARRGGFYPMPKYGSSLHTLSSIKPSLRETAARQFVQEALADESELVLDSLELSYESEDSILITAAFTYSGEIKLSVDTRI